MSQSASHPGYQRIVDTLDALAQRLRLLRLSRGAIVLIATAVIATPLAGLLAHLGGPGLLSQAALVAWGLAITLAVVVAFLRPLLMRPRPIEVARLVESRVPELHDGLSNAVLLAAADDLQHNRLLGPIYDEIADRAEPAPLHEAIRFADLLPLARRLALLAVPSLLLAILFFPQLVHGWRQMLTPGSFVPRAGVASIVDLSPGDATVVAGQPLEITVAATRVPADAAATLFVAPIDRPDDWAALPLAKLPSVVPDATPDPSNAGESVARFAHRLDRLDHSIRYRVEVAGTQSPIHTVTAVRDVTLARVTLRIDPPPYLRDRLPATSLVLDPDQLATTPLAFAEGSGIELAAETDVPLSSARLQIDDRPPVAVRREQDGTRFVGSFDLPGDRGVSVLFSDAGGQIVARLPDPPLRLRATPDSPPTIELRTPADDLTVAPDAEIAIDAIVRDDHALARVEVLVAVGADAPLASVFAQPLNAREHRLQHTLAIPPQARTHGQTIRLQLVATDARTLSPDLGPQTTTSRVVEIRLRDPSRLAQERQQEADRLRTLLRQLLDRQRALHEQAGSVDLAMPVTIRPIGRGQATLRDEMVRIAKTESFVGPAAVVEKALLGLASGPAKRASELPASIEREPDPAARAALRNELRSQQRRVIETLESLLAIVAREVAPATQPASAGGDLPNDAAAAADLLESLRQFEADQRRVLDQTAALAKRPVDDWTAADRRQLEELQLAQERLDSFLEQAISDFAKNAQQDTSNATLLRETMEIYSEVTMARDALNNEAVEMAIPFEDTAAELAEAIASNLERWLMDKPDRDQWKMEDPLAPTDVPLAELPGELEDIVGELLEQQEDLFEQMEDANANYADSADKGAGWDAADGPIANMSAKGVTGNALPNDNEMGGRSGEGRGGKSQGEIVEETASGKGGRDTPTRLDPTAFQAGQVKDTSSDPVGGASGGGKLAGQGGEGLEGPLPPPLLQQMQRLAQQQAAIRNTAERLQLQHRVWRFDQFKLLESIAMMRRVESDLASNRYTTALRRRDVLLESLDTSRLLLSSRLHVHHDTTPPPDAQLDEAIGDAMKGTLPPAWTPALREYYKKLGQDE
jgi:hypothetical protein